MSLLSRDQFKAIDKALKHLKDHIGYLENRHEELMETIEMVEWENLGGNDSNLYCPWCGEFKIDGHIPDCPRQKALENW